MAGSKRERQRAGREARRAALLAAQRRAARRRWIVGLGVLVLAVVGILLLMGGDDADDGTDVVADGTTTTAVAGGAASGSAAGEPCVARSEPLPTGAPEVPVVTGPPPTSLVVRDLKDGTGATVARGDTVTANYIGVSCSTGVIFDSSYSRGQAASFPLTGVIKGWQDGLPGMKVGGQRLLGIPGDQAYGAQGRPPAIRPDEALWFVVEIVETKSS